MCSEVKHLSDAAVYRWVVLFRRRIRPASRHCSSSPRFPGHLLGTTSLGVSKLVCGCGRTKITQVRHIGYVYEGVIGTAQLVNFFGGRTGASIFPIEVSVTHTRRIPDEFVGWYFRTFVGETR